jgi:general stress protein 26
VGRRGQVATAGAYFGQDVRGIVDRLLGEQLPDGGWNCEAENSAAGHLFCKARGMKKKLQQFYDMVENIDTAMFTTRRRDGHLVSRPMANQVAASGADLWFVTARDSSKIADLEQDSHVNLSYYKDRTREWVSVSGIAKISTSRRKIHELYRPDWKIWFGDEGGKQDGTADDPRMVLIGVDIETATFMEVTKPQPVVLFELVKGLVTGKAPELGETQVLTKAEARTNKRKPAAKK